MRPEALARAHLAARNFGFAESTARTGRREEPQPGPAAGRPRSRSSTPSARTRRRARLTPGSSRWPAGPTATCRSSAGSSAIVAGWKADKTWTAPRRQPADASGTDETAIDRIDLTTLGPLVWTPFPAEPFSGTDTDRQALDPGRPQGPECPRDLLPGRQVCPLHAAAPGLRQGIRGPREARTSTRSPSAPTTLEAARALKNNKDGIKFPMPILRRPQARTVQALPGLRRLREASRSTARS